MVYRAEATFVGLGLWDLYGALVSPGARVFWDKQHEDAVLLEDVNELTELWHFKTKPAWPVQCGSFTCYHYELILTCVQGSRQRPIENGL